MMIKSRWRYSGTEAKKRLGDDPMTHFDDPVAIKSNPVREVWRSGDLFFKFDKRPGHGFHKEFSRALALHKAGVPVVSHLACGVSRCGNCLITEALEDSVTLDEYLRDRIPDDAFLNALVDFLKLMEYRHVVHHDLHCGNILYVEKTNTFSLVDVRDAYPAGWLDFFMFSRMPFRRLLVELLEKVPEPRLWKLLRRMGVREPENFVTGVLERRASQLVREWPRRREQVLSGYPKFTRREGELLLVRSTQLSDLDQAEQISGDASVFAGAFYLDIARIPHRRIYAWSEQKNLLWAEPLSDDDVDSSAVAQMRSRALLFGVTSACRDWVCDASGLVKLAVWKGM